MVLLFIFWSLFFYWIFSYTGNIQHTFLRLFRPPHLSDRISPSTLSIPHISTSLCSLISPPSNFSPSSTTMFFFFKYLIHHLHHRWLWFCPMGSIVCRFSFVLMMMIILPRRLLSTKRSIFLLVVGRCWWLCSMEIIDRWKTCLFILSWSTILILLVNCGAARPVKCCSITCRKGHKCTSKQRVWSRSAKHLSRWTPITIETSVWCWRRPVHGIMMSMILLIEDTMLSEGTDVQTLRTCLCIIFLFQWMWWESLVVDKQSAQRLRNVLGKYEDWNIIRDACLSLMNQKLIWWATSSCTG